MPALPGDLHTVFCAECTANFDWKSAGVFYTHRVSGMPGKITRLLACTEEQKRAYPKSGLEMGPTFVHPNYVHNPHNGEISGSYNKPASVMHWVREVDIRETYVLFIDADMLLRAPIDPIALGVRKGQVVSEHVHYLDNGIRRHLVENFVPDPSMAKWAKAAGWYHIFHIDDLRAIAPGWLKYTERMRTSPHLYWDMNNSKASWNALARDAVRSERFTDKKTGRSVSYIKTGDDYVEYGEPPWISEMYGYVFSTSEQRIDTTLLSGRVQYTDSPVAAMPPRGPHIIHYGLHCHVNSYHFTKYDYANFDIGSCPLLFFRPPEKPRPNQALCAETINTLNDALCDFYRTRCPGAESLECAPHESDGKAICENEAENCAARETVKRGQCTDQDLRECRQACTHCCGDSDPKCRGWAFGGECHKNPAFMKSACQGSCKQCKAEGDAVPSHARSSSQLETDTASQVAAVASMHQQAIAKAVASAHRQATLGPHLQARSSATDGDVHPAQLLTELSILGFGSVLLLGCVMLASRRGSGPKAGVTKRHWEATRRPKFEVQSQSI